MDNKYLWYIIAALSGGYVLQVRRPEELPALRRISHLVSGAICAVYFSPYTIHYFALGDTEWQYLVPFAIGAFWWKAFEAFEAAAGSITIPWRK